MARPLKLNADFFPHDSDMRNDARVKAVRRKFGIEGYGIYCMAVEYLADQDHFMVDVTGLSMELMAGDFDIDPAKLKEVIDYCILIDLFQDDNGSLRCRSLEKRLSPLLSKRERDRYGVSDSENTHSKVKESKVKESKEEKREEKTRAWFDGCIDEMYKETLEMTHKGKDVNQAIAEAWVFLSADANRLRSADPSDVKKLVNTWLGNMKNGEKQPRKKAFEL